MLIYFLSVVFCGEGSLVSISIQVVYSLLSLFWLIFWCSIDLPDHSISYHPSRVMLTFHKMNRFWSKFDSIPIAFHCWLVANHWTIKIPLIIIPRRAVWKDQIHLKESIVLSRSKSSTMVNFSQFHQSITIWLEVRRMESSSNFRGCSTSFPNHQLSITTATIFQIPGAAFI